MQGTTPTAAEASAATGIVASCSNIAAGCTGTASAAATEAPGTTRATAVLRGATAARPTADAATTTVVRIISNSAATTISAAIKPIGLAARCSSEENSRATVPGVVGSSDRRKAEATTAASPIRGCTNGPAGATEPTTAPAAGVSG
jgi:hypothetical protein